MSVGVRKNSRNPPSLTLDAVVKSEDSFTTFEGLEGSDIPLAPEHAAKLRTNLGHEERPPPRAHLPPTRSSHNTPYERCQHRKEQALQGRQPQRTAQPGRTAPAGRGRRPPLTCVTIYGWIYTINSIDIQHSVRKVRILSYYYYE